MIRYSFLLVFLYLLLESCTATISVDPPKGNPASNGFNLDGSDSLAISIADDVMEAMGGRQNWDETRYLKWNFFGSRRHIWDRYNGNVIIEGIRDSFLAKINLNTLEGSVNMKGVELTKADSLDKYIEKAKKMWINDSYWLIFPFKLKDSGVTLKYFKQDTSAQGQTSHILQLTFNEVGVTPKNKYYAYVDSVSLLVNQWDFFPSFEDSLPRFNTAWSNYKQYDRIKLSSGRGDNYQITEISASDTLSQYFQ
jgi:hypothetical protein